MTTIDDVARLLEVWAPPQSAADWDNVGLLLGDRARPATRVLTCLTTTAEVVEEALAERVDLIVSHHPLPFRPQKTFTTDTLDGRLLWRLASAGVSLFSPHTAFDSAVCGINAALAEGLELRDVAPLEPIVGCADSSVGVGRRGTLPRTTPLDAVAVRLKTFLEIDGVEVAGDGERPIARVGLACGSGGELLAAAARAGCDCFVTGEARFHTVLEAEARGVSLLLLGHYASERFGLERLATRLAAALPNVAVWPSRRERNPLRRL